MEMKVGDLFRKLGFIKVVKVLKNGNVIVCDRNNISNVWEIDKEFFERNYLKIEDV